MKNTSKRTSRKMAYKKRIPSKARKPSKTLRNIIKTEIHKQAENKQQDYYNVGISLLTSNSGNFDSTNVFPVCFTNNPGLLIKQGTGQGDRIGNQIRVRKFWMTGVFVATSYNATTNPQPQPVQLKMIFFYIKGSPNTPPTPQANNDLLQIGSNQQGLQNDLTDMYAPFNRDVYTVVGSRTFKLGYQSSSGTGSQIAYQSFTNNDFKLNCNFKIDVTKMLPQIGRWDDNSNVSQSRQLYCCCFYASASGGQLASDLSLAGIQYILSCQFEDA